MPLAPIKEIDAVNIMLATIGSAPINSFNTPNVDVSIARNTLFEVSRMTQIHGWRFNTAVETRTPAVVGNSGGSVILLDNQTMLAEKAKPSERRNVTLRGGPPWAVANQGLWDIDNNTWYFTGAIELRLIYALDFDSMPMAARHYVAIRGARMFQDRMVGSEKHHAYSMRDEMMALAMLKRYESETRESSIFQNWDVARVIHRQYPIPGYTL